jgi:ankyrin repeat protein
MKYFITICTTMYLVFSSSYVLHGMELQDNAAVFEAAKKFDLGTVQQYLRRKWNFAQTDKDNNTVLHFLYGNKNGNQDYWKYVYAIQKDIRWVECRHSFRDVITSAKNNDGITPVALMSRNDKEIYAKTFYFFYRKTNNPHSFNIFKAFADAGVDVNVPVRGYNPYYFTLLHGACFDNQTDASVVEDILKKGALVNAQDSQELTPLCRTWDPRKIKILLAYEADVNVNIDVNLNLDHIDYYPNPTDSKITLLQYNWDKYYYCSSTQKQLLKLLIDHGAWIDPILSSFENQQEIPSGFENNQRKQETLVFALKYGELKPGRFSHTIQSTSPLSKTPTPLKDLCSHLLLSTQMLQVQQDLLYALTCIDDIRERILDHLTCFFSRADGTICLKKVVPITRFFPCLVSPRLIQHFKKSKNKEPEDLFLMELEKQFIEKVIQRYAEKKAAFKTDIIPVSVFESYPNLFAVRAEGIMEKFEPLPTYKKMRVKNKRRNSR